MKLKSKLLYGLLALLLAFSIVPSFNTKAAWMPDHDVGAYEQKNVYETERVSVGKISVLEVTNATMYPPATAEIEKNVKFIVYNSTLQQIDQEVESSNGELPELFLIKDHNYIFFAQDSTYRMNNVYIWVQEDGSMLNIKDVRNVDNNDGTWTNIYDYEPVTEFRMYKRDEEVTNPEDDRRVFVHIPVTPVVNLKIKLVSDVEIIEVVTGNNGKVNASLLEDTDYMVIADDPNWAVQSFPIAVKDKSEYDAGKYAYNHSDCHRVDEIQLVNKKNLHSTDTVLTNTNYDTVYASLPGYAALKGHTTITGLNFRDLLVLDRKLDSSNYSDISALAGKDFDVLDISIINPHRWEYTKLAEGEFKVTEQLDNDKQISQVAYIDKDRNLHEVNFTQTGSNVTFNMNSLAIYPIVFVYANDDPTKTYEPVTAPTLNYRNAETSGNTETTVSIQPTKEDDPLPAVTSLKLMSEKSGSFGEIKFTRPGVYHYDIFITKNNTKRKAYTCTYTVSYVDNKLEVSFNAK